MNGLVLQTSLPISINHQLDAYFGHLKRLYGDNPQFPGIRQTLPIIDNDPNRSPLAGNSGLICHRVSSHVYTALGGTSIYNPLLLVSGNIGTHSDSSTILYESLTRILPFLRTYNEAVSVMVPLRSLNNEGVEMSLGGNPVELSWGKQILIFDHTKEHFINDDGIKFFWFGLMRAISMKALAIRLDKIAKPI